MVVFEELKNTLNSVKVEEPVDETGAKLYEFKRTQVICKMDPGSVSLTCDEDGVFVITGSLVTG